MKRTYSLLLVDDEEANRLLLTRRLQQDGHAVMTAENGSVALDMMRVEQFDLVLLDMNMPVMDGLATLSAIKSDPMLKSATVVMLTAADSREQVINCLSLGAADYLIKPVNPLELKQRVLRCLESKAVRVEPAVRVEVTDLTGTRILIVDDEPLNLKLLDRRLRQAGFQVFSAQSGREALDLLARESVDAVLLDVNMPGMDGLEVLRAIRETEAWHFMPVLMLSADGDEQTVTRAYQLGADDYLVKPYDPQDLKLRLAVALDIGMAKIATIRQGGNFSRLFRRLLVGLIAMGILLLGLFGYKSWQDESQDIRNSLAIQAGFAAKSSQAVFDNIGISMELLGQFLTKTSVVTHPESARAALMEYKSNYPEIVAVSLISPQGAMLLSTHASPGEVLPDFRQDAPYIRAFLFDLNNTTAYTISRKQYGMGIKQGYFPFRHTVKDSSGNPLFVIQAALSAESAAMLWSDLPLLPESRIGLIRNDGYIQMLWPIEESEQLFNTPQSGAMMQAIHSNPGMTSGAYEGESEMGNSLRVGAYSHLPNATMAAFVSVPKKLIMLRWWEHNYPILLSFLVYLGAISAIAFKLTGMEQQHTHDLLAQSRKDPLTGLPNRIAIDEMLAREIARDRRDKSHSAILYLDLDKFKDINDKLGHASGDRLLERIALRIQTSLREEDVLARLGGDEFLVLLPNSDAEKASFVAQRIIELFSIPFQLSSQEIVISTSIGICLFPDNHNDSGTLLQDADIAMYEAKRQGRNCFVFYRQELGEHIRQRLQLKHDLLRALEHQEFFLHYQPLIDMASGQIVGAETLVRWMDPQKGLRNPADFIPFAEETGVILELGEWVLKTACKEAQSWAERGFELYIAVNLSTRQFQDPDLIAKVNHALAHAGLPHSKLELEITESASMLDPEASIQVMDELKALGIKLAIDDFGTGYSSLAYLKRIPANIIKIDRSFVNGVLNDQDDLAIVRAILLLGSSLGKHCLAEGIESAEQFEILNGLGCEFGQGYWMSRPILASDFLNLLSSGKRYFH